MRATLALAEVAERALAHGVCLSAFARCCCRILGKAARCALAHGARAPTVKRICRILSKTKKNSIPKTTTFTFHT